MPYPKLWARKKHELQNTPVTQMKIRKKNALILALLIAISISIQINIGFAQSVDINTMSILLKSRADAWTVMRNSAGIKGTIQTAKQ